MASSLTVIKASDLEDIEAVRALFNEYLQVLSTDFGKEIGCAGNQLDMQKFPDQFTALFLAKLQQGKTLMPAPIAACGLIRVNERDCELVRLYCRPEGRGHAIGRKLSLAACDLGRKQGYKRLVLSTEPIMRHAVKLYTNMGFVDIQNYADAPSACSKYMGLQL